MDAIYSKNTERTHAALLSISKEGLNTEALTANALKQMKRVKDDPDVVRVEIRGKKMRGAKLHQLTSLPNRFERFSFASLNAAGPELPPLPSAYDLGTLASPTAAMVKGTNLKIDGGWPLDDGGPSRLKAKHLSLFFKLRSQNVLCRGSV